MRKLLCVLMACLLLPCAQAQGNEVEILFDRVIFRASPGGVPLGHVHGGQVLELVGEAYLDSGDTMAGLWYRARSPEYGEGYVSAVYAMPVVGQRVYRPGGDYTVITDHLLSYLDALYRYQVENGYLSIKAGQDYFSFTWDESAVTPDTCVEMALLLYEHQIILRDESYARLADPAVPAQDKRALAQAVLQNHYGTHDPWVCMTRATTNGSIWVDDSDWHAPRNAAGEERRLLEERRTKVLSEYQ